jgi:hypothetical protein
MVVSDRDATKGSGEMEASGREFVYSDPLQP